MLDAARLCENSSAEDVDNDDDGTVKQFKYERGLPRMTDTMMKATRRRKSNAHIIMRPRLACEQKKGMEMRA